MKKFIVLCALVSYVLAASLTLKATVRDFSPSKTPSDFESTIIGLVTGLVESTLDGDGKPVRSGLSVCCSDKINQWYRSIPGVNVEIPIEIELTDAATPGLFTFESAAFFPADNLGFGNEGRNHNFHFTTEISTTFTFNAAVTNIFTFTGDDDVWVFIDNKLALDIGGVHGAVSKSVDLNTLGLVNGDTYSLKVFHAERHTVQSNFKMQTTLTLIPDDPKPPENVPVDLCGVSYVSSCAQDTDCLAKLPPKFNSFGAGLINSPFIQYNALSFGDFNVATGDTEGRVAVGGSFSSSGGYSVGELVVTTGANKVLDPASFSLIIGQNLNWQNGGRVDPLGPNFTPGYANPSQREIVFVAGGVQSVPAGVEVRGPPPSAAQLKTDFDYAKLYYSHVSSELAALTSNAAASAGEGLSLKVTCDNANADSYVINVDGSLISASSSYTFAGCNPTAQYIFNVGGNGAVTFKGDNIHLPDEEKAIVRIVFNILGSRSIRVETRVHGHIIAPSSSLTQVGGVIVGLVIVGNYETNGQASQINLPRCPTPPTYENPPPQGICPYFENDFECDLSLRLGDRIASFKDFNVVSFKDYTANTGDIQGRLIAKENLDLGFGYSIGDQIDSTPSGRDNSLPFAAIIGGNADWQSGALFPDVSPPAANQGAPEGIFVGGNFNAPDFLKARRTPLIALPNLEADFAHAFECYSGIQNFLASKPTNVQFTIEFQGLHVKCVDPQASEFVINIDGAVLSGITWYSTENCNFGSRYVFNVLGNGDVTFQGDHFPAISGGVVYNVVGANRVINVLTQVNGNILAPRNSINQRGGVIVGKVVIGNFLFGLQVNVPNCPDDIEPEEVPIIVITPPTPGDNEIEYEHGGDCIKQGDEVKFPDGKEYTVASVNGKKVTFTTPITSPAAQGSRNILIISDPVIPRGPNGGTSSAVSVVASATLVVLALVAILF